MSEINEIELTEIIERLFIENNEVKGEAVRELAVLRLA